MLDVNERKSDGGYGGNRYGGKPSRGKLTVFLGIAAGTGKTYTMLEKARDLRRSGVDVVIGFLEANDTLIQGFAAGMRKIPEKVLGHKDAAFTEMDIDAILLRKPAVVLIDELAHTNAPGSRHMRRFQDVEEILEAGITVFTTLNIGHIESLQDVVARITGSSAGETVPDYIVEQADSVQYVDILPAELINRLKEGRIGVSSTDRDFPRDLYRLDKLDALRTILFRFAASRLERELEQYIRNEQITDIRPPSAIVMACIDASPFSAQLIRVAKRLARGLQAQLLVVHIEPAHRLSAGDEEDIARHLRLAEELGAQTLIQTGEDIAEEILEVAHSHNVTAIVAGRPRRRWLSSLLHPALVDRLLRRSFGIALYVVDQTEKPVARVLPVPGRQPLNWLHYIGCIALIAAVSGLGWMLRERLELVNIALFYQLPVMLSAFWWGRWPSYFTSVGSVLAFNYIFVPPLFAIQAYDRFIWSSLNFFIVSYVIGGRTERLRDEAAAARQRERSTHALFDFSRAIAAVIDLDTIVSEFTAQATKILGRELTLFLPNDKGRLVCWIDTARNIASRTTDTDPAAESGECEAAALWAFSHRQMAGKSTATLPDTDYLYLPLITRDAAVGVLGVHIAEKRIALEQRRLMETWAGLAAIAIERVKLTEKAREATLLLESDRLRAALINSVSHELRTPLSLIIGSASTLFEAEASYTHEERRELLENIKHGANRMERVVANLLDTARLESGMMRLKNDWCDMQDIIGTALRRLSDQIKDRPLSIRVADDMPLLRGDCVLLEQVMINLIDNALKYSSSASEIGIVASEKDDILVVWVDDCGAGIPGEDLPHIFDKFYRAQHNKDTVSGTGLGLSICKSIVEAHGGGVFAENRHGGGARIGFRLPLNDTLTSGLAKGRDIDD